MASSRNKKSIAVTLALFVVGLISLITGIYIWSSGGKLIHSAQVVLCDSRIEATNCTESKLPIGPIILDGVNRVHNIRVISHTTSSANWNTITAHLLNSEGTPLLGFIGEFYEEYWSEGGESGIERVDSVNKKFRLTSVGEYYIDIETDKEFINNLPDVYTVNVYGNSAAYEYFFIFAGIILMWGFIRLDPTKKL